MTRRIAAPLFALSLLLALAMPGAAQRERTPIGRFGLSVHVGADADGEPSAERVLLERWVHEASEHFAPAGIGFDLERVHAMPADSAVLRTISDRHRLRPHLVDRQINVFVVSRIEDPHASRATRRQAERQGIELSGRLGGAHIPARGRRPETYLIVNAGPSSISLTHELGHFFGAGHHADPTNIMSYGRNRVRFDERQIRAFRHYGRRYVRQRILRPIR